MIIGGPDDIAPPNHVYDHQDVTIGDQFDRIYTAAVLLEAVADRDAVIARLLDGWEHDTISNTWWGDTVREEGGDLFEPMSDGEAAIIRAHQEKNA